MFLASFLFLWPCFAQKSSPNLLILNSYHPGYAWTDAELAGLRARLAEEYPDLPPSIEYLDTKRFPSEDRLNLVKDYLAAKYRDRKFDLVIVLDNSALSMALNYREELFPGVPIVFAGINDFRTRDAVRTQGCHRRGGKGQHRRDTGNRTGLASPLQTDLRGQ